MNRHARSIRFLALLFFAASVVCAGAQAIPGPPATITFDVTLPAGTPDGETIYVAGNFQGWDPGKTPLTRDGLHARGTVTVNQLTIEYKFTRGTWDKVERAADCSDISNRQATVQNGATYAATVLAWADLCSGGSGSSLDTRAQKITIDSAALGVPKSFYIYTPPGYDARPARRYPVVYLFRGHESEWINRNQDATRGGRDVIDVYEELLAAGNVGPMILVFPGISSDDNAVSGMLTNFIAPGLTNAPGVGTGAFEDYFVKEIIPYVDANFRTIASRDARGVDGFSLGGFMSAKIAAQHAELFSTAGMFDGTHFYANSDCTQIDTVRDTTFGNAMFDPVFGNPRDAHYAALNNGPTLVCNSTPEALRSVHWFVQYGPLTSEPNDANYLRGDHFVQKLQEKGVANEITPAVLEGGHHWATADTHMRATLPLHWNVLGRATYPQPDLVVANVAAAKGPPATITATVRNNGAAASPASSVHVTDGSTAIGDATVPVLAPGASAQVVLQWQSRPAKGDHLIAATADADNRIDESNETNNWARRTVTVRGDKITNGALERP